MGARAFAREEYLRRDVIVIEQPAQNVDLMDQRVVDRHRRDVAIGHRLVAVGGVDHQRRADPRQRGLERDVAAIVAAHEADLHQPGAVRGLGLDDAAGGVRRRGQRLLAKARLAGGDRAEDLRLVRLAHRARPQEGRRRRGCPGQPGQRAGHHHL